MKALRPILFAVVMLIAFILLGMLTPSIAAQDSTQEAIATVEAHPIEIIDGGGETAGMSPLLQLALSASALIVALSFAFEKLGNRAKAANNNPFETAALEKLGDGVPSVVVLSITGALERVTTAFESITQTFKEATDGIPKSEKPVETPAPNAFKSTPASNLQDGM